MKKLVIYLLLVCIVISNIYLIFYWEPQNIDINKEEFSKEAITYSESLYRLDKKKILERLSSDDKRDLEKIIKKLSTFDIGKIEEYYEYSNEEEGVTNIFRLLKKRLTTEDYKEIERITDLFLDLEKINAIIKK